MDKYDHTINKISSLGAITILAGNSAGLESPQNVTTDLAGKTYVTDGGSILKITSPDYVTTFVGNTHFGNVDGTGDVARFSGSLGITTDKGGNFYVTDKFNFTIRKITPLGIVTTLAGSAGISGNVDGWGTAARFYYPTDLTIDGEGNLYVADYNNFTIRKISPSGEVTTIADTKGMRGFGTMNGITIDNSGNLYVTGNVGGILKITQSGAVTTLAGGGTGSADGIGTAAKFNNPRGITTDDVGNLYVCDTGNNTIRKITPSGTVTTVAGSIGQRNLVLGNLPGQLYAPTGIKFIGENTFFITTGKSIVKLVLP